MSFSPERPASSEADSPSTRSRFSRVGRARKAPPTDPFAKSGGSSSQTKYFLITDSNDMNMAANSKTVLGSVGVTVVATGIAFMTASSMAFTHHRAENHLPPQVVHGLFGDYMGPASVGYSMLNGWLQAALLAVVLLYPIIHALLGRCVFSALHGLCVLGDEVFRPEPSRCIGKWPAEAKMIAGAIWPVSMLLIPFLAVGVALGALYRRLWAEPVRQ